LKGIFLKQLCTDILADGKKSTQWHEYSLLYPQLGYGEQLRTIWRQFKSTHASKGFWAIGEEISADDKILVEETLKLLKVEPKGEKNEVVMSALNTDGTIMDLDSYALKYNLDKSEIKSYKLITHNGKAPYYNIQSKDISLNQNLEEFGARIIEEIKNIKTLPKTVVRDEIQDGHLLVVDLADIHIGKLASSFETGEDYNNQIAVQRCKEGLEGLIKKASGFNIEQIVFIGGNDILHIDTPKATTTSGTFQNTDGMWYDNFLIAKQLYIDLLDRLLEIADVHFTFNPSNHDYMSGFFLADVIKTYYKDKQNITFDCSIAHRKYYKYNDNLIGTTHGDGARLETLPMLMAAEAKDWSSCKHRYIYTHHVHHKTLKDFPGVTIESLRSPSGTDSWHHRNGFTGAPKAVEAFIHHPIYGQSAKLVHLF
jgi:hypothetical protein